MIQSGLEYQSIDRLMEAVPSTRMVRFARRCIRAAIVLESIRPLLTIAGALALMAVSTAATAFGQPPPGSLLGDDAQKPLTAYRKIFDILMWGTVIYGAGSLAWGAVQGSRKREWGNSVFWGGVCLGIGGVIALVRAIVDGGVFTLPQI